MAKVFTSLKDISTGYKVFERDQVLTEEQLNRLADYMDDQQRLTRVALLGVGIVCGLRASTTEAGVMLSKGVGVTSDGDLLRVPDDLTYTRFRLYDQAAPRYDLFFDGNNMRKVYELTGGEVTAATTLDKFAQQSQKNLTDMVAVLLMESFIKDSDVCTGGDCDNKGKDAISNVKLLLLEPKDIAALREKVPTLDAAARDMPDPVYADRVKLVEGINTVLEVAQAYRAAAANTVKRLNAAFDKLWAKCSWFLSDIFPGNPAPAWKQRLNAPASDDVAQSFYDFVKDVVDTYNAFRDAAFDDVVVCCPSYSAFPKHLLLGGVGAAVGDDTNRTRFYPSPLVRDRADTLDRARFLARKIDTLIASFKPAVDATAPIAVTPSYGEDRALDERAIPSYYTPNTPEGWPIHRAWSQALERRGMAAFNYAARAREFGGKGAALAPLTAQIGRYNFFRVEGHLGHAVTPAVDEIEKAITRNNLPFVVRAVLLGAERPKIVVKPPVRYTDIHRLHYLVRQDVTHQIDDVVLQTNAFKTQVDRAVKDNVVANEPIGTGMSTINEFADEKRKGVTASAATAKKKLSQPYAAYSKAPNWQADIKQVVTHATEMKYNLGHIARTEFATPVDAITTNNHMLWVDWLDRIIQTKDNAEDDKLLFPAFLKNHPAAEHFGGVSRGGTFVLLYDGNGIVVGDVSLPYWWPETAQPQPAEPTLPRPDIKPPILIDKGIRILPRVDDLIMKNIDLKLIDFKKIEVEPIKQQTVDFGKNYVQAIKDSLNVITYTPGRSLQPSVPQVADPQLGILMNDMRSKMSKAEQVQQLILDPSTDPGMRETLTAQLKATQGEIEKAVIDTSNYVATAKIDATTDGVAAMNITSQAFQKLSNDSAAKVAKQVTTNVQSAGAAVQAPIKLMISGMLGMR